MFKTLTAGSHSEPVRVEGKEKKQGRGVFFPGELTVLGRRRGAEGKQGEGLSVLRDARMGYWWSLGWWCGM